MLQPECAALCRCGQLWHAQRLLHLSHAAGNCCATPRCNSPGSPSSFHCSPRLIAPFSHRVAFAPDVKRVLLPHLNTFSTVWHVLPRCFLPQQHPLPLPSLSLWTNEVNSLPKRKHLPTVVYALLRRCLLYLLYFSIIAVFPTLPRPLFLPLSISLLLSCLMEKLCKFP